MRVIVVDDSAFMRRAIVRMLQSEPDIKVVATARNGREAVEAAEKHRPDVITLDIEMPEMDGLTALRHIMRQCPTQVLMLSSLTVDGSHAALRSLHLGAADVLAKDTSQVSLKIDDLRDDLICRIRALAGASSAPKVKTSPPREAGPPTLKPRQFDLICIGSSTGGPPVVEKLVAGLPAELRAPVMIAQHMPKVFTASMAERLNDMCPLKVVHGEQGMPIERSTVYIAPGGTHTHVQRDGLARWSLQLRDEPTSALYRPSADVLFQTAADATRGRTLAILLTGIGSDGLEGAKHLHKLGGTILAQSQETCVVYGMPKGVTEQGIAAASLSPAQISQALQTLRPNVNPTPMAG